MGKRLFDAFSALLGLIILSPVLLAIALLVLILQGAPIIFRHKRVGRYGREFELYKFRTMKVLHDTRQDSFDAGDLSRVTGLGALLRASKLDELPQLWNVLKGDMSLVGPRPEVRKWIAVFPERWRKVLVVRPGITDNASIEFRNEEIILAEASDPEREYREVILPRKLDLYEAYVANRSLVGDLKIILRTLLALMGDDERQE
jgi:lipopolysaccharide/colanic/teichoic acid biosynthesis glycosyltransferase